MNWYMQVLNKYAVFSGRARRKEYWYFTLFNVIIISIFSFIDRNTGTFDDETGVGLLGGIYALAVFVPALGVLVRRLHDTGRSGWWALIGLIPVLGAIVLFIFLVQDSKPGTNQHGPNPKETAALPGDISPRQA